MLSDLVVVSRPAVRLAGYYGAYTGDDEAPGWSEADRRFGAGRAAIRGRRGDAVYGFLYRPHRDHPEVSPDVRACFVGVEVDEKAEQPEGVALTGFGGGDYALVECRGDTSAEAAVGVGQAVGRIAAWIPEHGWSPGEACFALSHEGETRPPYVELVYFQLQRPADALGVDRKLRRARRDLASGFGAIHRPVSDQARGLDRGPLQRPVPVGAVVVTLPAADRAVITKGDIWDCIADRRSRRKLGAEPVSLAELSYLLWATQAVQKMRGGVGTLRAVASGGAMHPLETWLAVHNVTGLAGGIWRYQPVDHALVKVGSPRRLAQRVIEAAQGQRFVGECAVTFIWTAVPYRTEWRYGPEARKLILQDSGHLCQNLYLACESIGCGTCAVGAYHQRKFDRLLGVDGREELVVYVAPVGRV